jgi:hypothetical protein
LRPAAYSRDGVAGATRASLVVYSLDRDVDALLSGLDELSMSEDDNEITKIKFAAASKRRGGDRKSARIGVTSLIICPPVMNGGMDASSSRRPHRTPIPVGPYVLWPEMRRNRHPGSARRALRSVKHNLGPDCAGGLHNPSDVCQGASHIEQWVSATSQQR